MRLPTSRFSLGLLVCLLLALPRTAGAQTTFSVASESDLLSALSAAQLGDTILFTANITLTQNLPWIITDLTINGAGFTLSGAGQYRGLVIGDPGPSTPPLVSVSIQNLTIANTVASGGAGQPSSDGGGGGGGGLGGAIFVANTASVTLSGVNIVDSSAVGGSGGNASGPGGGGTGGAGIGAVGIGGLGSQQIPTNGGYGGGGGGTLFGSPGVSQFGGGTGGAGSANDGGGGGAALGGAVFVQSGGSLDVTGGLTINGSSVTAGLGGTGAANGSAYGAGLFLGGSGSVTFAPGAGETVSIADSIADAQGASGIVGAGSWSVVKDGAGTLVLSGANQYSGSTSVFNGTLSINSDANLGVPIGSLFLSGPSTLALTGGNTFARDLFLDASGGNPTIRVGSGVDATWSGVIAEEVPTVLRVTGGGSLALTNISNSYSGGTIVTGGSRVVISDDLALGAPTGGVQLGDAVSTGTLGLLTGSTTTSTRGFVLGGAGGVFDVPSASSLTLGGAVTGLGSLTKLGTGTLILSATNTYTGGTNISAGTLRTGATNIFAATGGVNVGTGATFDLNSFNQTVASLSGAGTVTLGSATLITGGDSADTTFTGVISGTGSLLKTGTGAFTLLGANTYLGGTSVSQGTLIGNTTSLQGGIGIGNSAVVVFDQSTNGTYASVMNGPGSLVKRGAGAVTLSGANSYSGGTTVEAGSLIGTTTSLQGNIVNNASVVFDQAASGTYSSVMNGTGSLTKSGAGALTLSGANTYSGGTTVSGGSLLGTTTSLQGNIVNNASVVFDQAVDGTYAGAMSGTGSLTKSGAGALTLNGANAYSGGTTVSGGSLIGTTTSVQGNILNNTSVVFDQVGNGTYAGAMSGTGSLVKTGIGAVTLSGANTYSGGTTVSGGSLIGTTSSVQGNIVNNASVVFDQAINGTYTGVMTGTGPLTKSGTGIVTLTGANTYSGGTTVSAGVLTGTTTSLQGNIANSAAVTFDQAFNGGYAGVLSGSGSLTKAGAGTLTLSGANTYTGATVVNGGVLRVGSSTALGVNSALSLSGGTTLDLNGFSQSVGSIDGTGNITLGTVTLTTGGDNTTTTFGGILSGSGSLVKTGTGALTLSGANAYSGGTTVLGGSLVGSTTSLQGNILNNALVRFDQAFNGTYAGSMSGSGSLSKSGAGTLTLTGVNTYTGGTTVSGGTLIGTSTSLQGSITTNGLLVFDQAFNGTFAGSISGNGSLQKLGTGTLTLNSTSAFTGATTISTGTVRAGAANVFSSGAPISIAAGATLDLNGFSHTLNGLSGSGDIALGSATLTTGTDGGSTTIAGVISGSGSLVKSGSGTLALAGANTYSGGTTVSGGILLGTTTSLQGNILNDARVVFAQGFNGTYAGAMSGAGILEKAGTGVLTLAGTNTYTGGTVISGGSVVATPTSLGGPILNNGSLIFGGAFDGALGGTLGGNGALNKTGSHTLTLNGTHPLSGLTTVSQGTLALNGILGGSVTVAPGATLRANGTVLGTVNVNGTLSVPSSATSLSGFTSGAAIAASTGDRLTTPPELTIGGNLVAGPDSVLALPIGPGANPSLLVGGVAALNGTRLDATPIELGTQRTLSFLALSAGDSLTVANTTVATQNPLLISSLKQDGRSLFVTMFNLGVPLASAVSPGFTSVGAALDRMKGDMTGDRGFVIRELLALPDDELEDAMRVIAGELHASNQHIAVRSSEMFTDLIRSEMTEREHEAEDGQTGWGGERIRWFGQFSREHASFDPAGAAFGGAADLSDGAGGFEFRLSDRFLVGGGGGFGFGSMALDGLAAASDFSAPRAFGVVGFKPKAFSLRGGGSFSRSRSKSKRTIIIIATLPLELGGGPLSGGINREAASEEVTVQNDQWSEYADHQDFGTYRLDYMLGVRRARFARDGFTETGAGALSLRSDGETMNLTDTDVKIYLWRRKGNVRPYVETLVRRSSGFQYRLPVEFAEDENSDFETAGLPMGQNAFASRMGVTLVRRIGTLTFEYRIRKASGQTVQSGDLRFRF